MKFAVLALLGMATLEEVAAKHHKHHHHHHKHHKKEEEPQSLAQKQDAPANPDSNRSTFEKARADAANTVATQQAFEAAKTADVAARNAANIQETANLKAHVTRARDD